VRFDAEVGERLDERFRRALDCLLGLALLVLLGAPEDARVRKPVPSMFGRSWIKQTWFRRRGFGFEVLELMDEDGRWRGSLVDDVGVDDLPVHGRLVRLCDRLVVERDAHPFRGFPGGVARGVRRPAEDRAERSAREQEHAGDEREDAEDIRARLSEQATEQEGERLTRSAPALLAQDRHEAEPRDDQTGPEGPHGDEGRAPDHEGADDEKDERDEDTGLAN
jgi:hypothetical protein